jgi:hypothetical protein
MDYAYYILKDGELRASIMKKAAEKQAQTDEQFEIVKQLAEEHGCSSKHVLSRGDVVVGLYFGKDKDKEDNSPVDLMRIEMPQTVGMEWKHIEGNAWWPNQNTKKGEAMAKLFKKFKTIDLNEALPDLPAFQRQFVLPRMYTPRILILKYDHEMTIDEYLVMLEVPFNDQEIEKPNLPRKVSSQLKKIRKSVWTKIINDYNQIIAEKREKEAEKAKRAARRAAKKAEKEAANV